MGTLSLGAIKAANFNWDGGGGADTNWSTASNWNPDIAIANDQTATAVFTGSLPATFTSTVDIPFDIQYLRFSTSSVGTLNSLSGAAITIRGDAALGHDADLLINNSNATTQIINANLILAKGGKIDGNLTINGNIAANGTALRFTAGTVRVNGILSSANAGDRVAVNGANVTFNNANTFTKLMTIWSGTARAEVDSLSGVAGAFGNSTSAINMGHSTAGSATLLTGNAVTIGRSIEMFSSSNTGFTFYTVGGDTAHTSNYTGNILTGSPTTTTGPPVVNNTDALAIQLTAASGGRVNFSGNIQRSGTATGSRDNVVKVGQGTVAINGATNNWEGETQVNAGVLYVNGTLQATTSGKGITVASSSTFGGTGTANRSVTLANGGILSAGDVTANNGAGKLTLGVSSGTGLTLNSTGGSVMNFQVTHTGDVNNANLASNIGMNGSLNWSAILGSTLESGVNNDTLAVQGNWVQNATGKTTINLATIGAGSFTAGMVWDLMDWTLVDGVSGALASSKYNLVIDSAFQSQLSANGLSLDTSRFWDTGYVGVIPEPSRALLLMLGGMGLMFRRRR